MTGVASLTKADLEEDDYLLPVKNVLVMGSIERWHAEGRPTHDIEGFAFRNLASVNEDILRELDPDIILSPLFGDDFDAFDVAATLAEFGYQKRYRVIADPIPNADLIRNEIRELAPALDFDLLIISQPLDFE